MNIEVSLRSLISKDKILSATKKLGVFTIIQDAPKGLFIVCLDQAMEEIATEHILYRA